MQFLMNFLLLGSTATGSAEAVQTSAEPTSPSSSSCHFDQTSGFNSSLAPATLNTIRQRGGKRWKRILFCVAAAVLVFAFSRTLIEDSENSKGSKVHCSILGVQFMCAQAAPPSSLERKRVVEPDEDGFSISSGARQSGINAVTVVAENTETDGSESQHPSPYSPYSDSGDDNGENAPVELFRTGSATGEFDLTEFLEGEPLLNLEVLLEDEVAETIQGGAKSNDWPAIPRGDDDGGAKGQHDGNDINGNSSKYDAIAPEEERMQFGGQGDLSQSEARSFEGRLNRGDMVTFGQTRRHKAREQRHVFHKDRTDMNDQIFLHGVDSGISKNNNNDAVTKNVITSPPHDVSSMTVGLSKAVSFEYDVGAQTGGRAAAPVLQRRAIRYSGADHYTDAAYARALMKGDDGADDDVVDGDGYMVAGTGDKAADDGPEPNVPGDDNEEPEDDVAIVGDQTFSRSSAQESKVPGWGPESPRSGNHLGTSSMNSPTSQLKEAPMGAVADSSVRATVLNTGMAVRDGLTFDMKREIQARWREYRGSYPTLRELIRQLVTAYKEEQRVKRECLSLFASRQHKDVFINNNNNSGDITSSSCSSSSRKTKTKANMSVAECAASLPTLRTSLDWVRYLPYVPIYPIDEAVKHLEHEKDDDILLALFYAPDLFNTYNYIQWIGLMVKATCSLLRAGALDPIANVPDDDYKSVFGNASQHPGMNVDGNNKNSDSPLYCKNLVLPDTAGLLSAEDVQRLRSNTARIAIIDSYYPQRNVTRKLWKHLGTDMYMVNEDEWNPLPFNSGKESDDVTGNSAEEDTDTSNNNISNNSVCSSQGDSAEQASQDFSLYTLRNSSYRPSNSTLCANYNPIAETAQSNLEDWGPVFIEQRNALLRLLAREGGLFKEVQDAFHTSSRPWHGGQYEGGGGDNNNNNGIVGRAGSAAGLSDALIEDQHMQHGTLDGVYQRTGGVRAAQLQHWGEDQTHTDQRSHRFQERHTSANASSSSAGHLMDDSSIHQDSHASKVTQTAPPARMADAFEDNDRIHFLARYIIEQTDDLIVTQPQMLLEVLQHSFNRVRRREQRLVEKIFSWGQIMKYRVHVNVSAQRIDEFSSDHVCEVRYQVYLHSPHTFAGAAAGEDMIGGSGGAGNEEGKKRLLGSRQGLLPTLWSGDYRALSEDPRDDYNVNGFASRTSCYYYQQLRNLRTTAGLKSVSKLQRMKEQRSAILASATAKDATAHISKAKSTSAASKIRKSVNPHEVTAVHEKAAEGEIPGAVSRVGHLNSKGLVAAAEDQAQQLQHTKRNEHAKGLPEYGDNSHVDPDFHAEAHRRVLHASSIVSRPPHYRRGLAGTSMLVDADALMSRSSNDTVSMPSEWEQLEGATGQHDHRPGSEEYVMEESEEDRDEEDEYGLFDEVLSHEDEQDDFHEMHIRYVDGMDELAFEENPELVSFSSEGGNRKNEEGRLHTVVISDAASSSGSQSHSCVAERGISGNSGGSGGSKTTDMPYSTMPATRSVSDTTSVSSLRLLGTAARRNYLLRQNPPVLLFPRKQGSRPYMFPQTLLQLVLLNFANTRGQLPPREHARRLRHRWGCEETPLTADVSTECSSSTLNHDCTVSLDASAHSHNAFCSVNCSNTSPSPSSCMLFDKSNPQNSSGNSTKDTAAAGADAGAFSAFADASTSATRSPPTPSTYRVVSVLDNPFSRIGVEHLHYDFVISGPASPTAVLQLLVEEARRVSTPGELETRSHRESIYRLQHRQWLEARQKRAVAAAQKVGEGKKRRKGATGVKNTVHNAADDYSLERDTRGKTGETAGTVHTSDQSMRSNGARRASTNQSSIRTISGTMNKHSNKNVNDGSSCDIISGDDDIAALSHDVFEQLPQEELARREYRNHPQTWKERLLEKTAKDLTAYLVDGKVIVETGDAESSGLSSSGSPSSPLTTPAGNNSKNSDKNGSAHLDSNTEQATGRRVINNTSHPQDSIVGGITDEEEDEVYFFEHDISFRLDPDRFVESAPLTLHFLLRTPTHVVETEIIEPLKQHVQILRQRLVEDILADAFQYAGCYISGNRYVQLLHQGAGAEYFNGSRIALPLERNNYKLRSLSSGSIALSSSAPPTEEGSSSHINGDGAQEQPHVPYAYTEDGRRLILCMRNSAAIWVWRLTAEMQAQEIQRAFADRIESDSFTLRNVSSSCNATRLEPPHPYPLPRDAVSFLELLHMPYDTANDPGALSETEAGGEDYTDAVPLYRSHFNRHLYESVLNADAIFKRANYTEAEQSKRLEQRFTYERLFLMQIAFRELMKRSNPGATESFFQLVTINREAAMRVPPNDSSRVVHRTLPSSITATGALPVAASEPVYPQECLAAHSNTYIAIMYLFFNGTAERYFRSHPLNQRRLRLMQRLNEAVRLSRQARLILLTASEDDYRTHYVDSVIQDASRRFYIIHQINRNTDTAVREWWLNQQQQQQQRSFSTGRTDADDVALPSDDGTRPLSDKTRAHTLLSFDDRGTGADAGLSSVAAPFSGNDRRRSTSPLDLSDDGEDQSSMYESYPHLSPFQFNIINYDVETTNEPAPASGGTPEGRSAAAFAAGSEPAKGRRGPVKGSRSSSPLTSFSTATASNALGVDEGRGPGATVCSDTTASSPSRDDGSLRGAAAGGTSDPFSPAATRRTGILEDQSSISARSVEDNDDVVPSTLYGHEVPDNGVGTSGICTESDEAARLCVLGRGRVGSFSGAASSTERKNWKDRWRSAYPAPWRRPYNRNGDRDSEEQRAVERPLVEKVPLFEEELHQSQLVAGSIGDDDSSFSSSESAAKTGDVSGVQLELRQQEEPKQEPRWRRWLFFRRGKQQTESQNMSSIDGKKPYVVREQQVHANSDEDNNVKKSLNVWQRQPSSVVGGREGDEDVGDFDEHDEFEQGDDEGADVSHLITGEKTEYEEGFPFPWRHGEVPKQELRRRLEEHQRHVRELKRRLIDVRLRWASAMWNERERPGGAKPSQQQQQQSSQDRQQKPEDSRGRDKGKQQQEPVSERQQG